MSSRRICALVVVLAALPALARAQEARLVGRLPDAARASVDSILESARGRGLPVEPLVDRALEGAAMGAAPGIIVGAIRRLPAVRDNPQLSRYDSHSPQRSATSMARFRRTRRPGRQGPSRHPSTEPFS